jgi:hypothetical protein
MSVVAQSLTKEDIKNREFKGYKLIEYIERLEEGKSIGDLGTS